VGEKIMGGRGYCRAENGGGWQIANSEWRVANGKEFGGQCSCTAEKFWLIRRKRQRMANSNWFFWSPALLKKFGTSGDVPFSLSACFSRLHFRSHRLQSVGKMVGQG